tara:strand:+ start:1350 stop:1772 length:423 start_codon:yes stop_codon:yes gene_type:complete
MSTSRRGFLGFLLGIPVVVSDFLRPDEVALVPTPEVPPGDLKVKRSGPTLVREEDGTRLYRYEITCRLRLRAQDYLRRHHPEFRVKRVEPSPSPRYTRVAIHHEKRPDLLYALDTTRVWLERDLELSVKDYWAWDKREDP